MAEYLKIPEVARRLDVSEKTARRYVKAGELPSVFIGGAYRVSEEDLEEYLKESRVGPGGDSPKEQAPLPLEPEVAGRLLLERARDTLLQDEDKARQAINRSKASEGTMQSVTSFEEDKFRSELRALGFPDEYFEDFIWPLVVENMRLREENTMLRDRLQEREQAHA